MRRQNAHVRLPIAFADSDRMFRLAKLSPEPFVNFAAAMLETGVGRRSDRKKTVRSLSGTFARRLTRCRSNHSMDGRMASQPCCPWRICCTHCRTERPVNAVTNLVGKPRQIQSLHSPITGCALLGSVPPSQSSPRPAVDNANNASIAEAPDTAPMQDLASGPF